MTVTDTIETRGFLSREIDVGRDIYREKYAEVFAICEAKSDSATANLFGACVPDAFEKGRLHIGLALGHWCRCVAACQAALLLLERGMVPEAQILIRSAYEFLFVAAATVQDSDVMESLMHGDTYARYEQAKCMLKEGNKAGHLTQVEIDALNDLIAEGIGRKQISVFEAADRVGLSYLYATVYKGLSLVGSHATAAATDSVFADDGARVQASFGPSDRGLPFCVGLVDQCLAIGAEHFDPILRSVAKP